MLFITVRHTCTTPARSIRLHNNDMIEEEEKEVTAGSPAFSKLCEHMKEQDKTFLKDETSSE